MDGEVPPQREYTTPAKMLRPRILRRGECASQLDACGWGTCGHYARQARYGQAHRLVKGGARPAGPAPSAFSGRKLFAYADALDRRQVHGFGIGVGKLVEPWGFEPQTFSLRTRRSTN